MTRMVFRIRLASYKCFRGKVQAYGNTYCYAPYLARHNIPPSSCATDICVWHSQSCCNITCKKNKPGLILGCVGVVSSGVWFLSDLRRVPSQLNLLFWVELRVTPTYLLTLGAMLKLRICTCLGKLFNYFPLCWNTENNELPHDTNAHRHACPWGSLQIILNK